MNHFDKTTCLNKSCRRAHEGDVIPVTPPETTTQTSANGYSARTTEMPTEWFVKSRSYFAHVRRSRELRVWTCTCPFGQPDGEPRHLRSDGQLCHHIRDVEAWASAFVRSVYDRPASPPAISALVD